MNFCVAPYSNEVVQALPDTPELTVEGVEEVLDSVRPFLAVAKGTIEVHELVGVGGLQPRLQLKMTGNASTLQSIRREIMDRINRQFMTPGLRIEWYEKKG